VRANRNDALGWLAPSVLGPPLTVGIVAGDLASGSHAPLLLYLAAFLILGSAWRTWEKKLFLSLALLCLGLLGRFQLTYEQTHREERFRALSGDRLKALQARGQALVSLLQASALHVGGLPETRAALLGDTAARSRLFQTLDAERARLRQSPTLAVYSPKASSAVAWAGRVSNAPLAAGEGRGLFVLAGSVSTVLVAVAPVAGDGGSLGFATAEIPVRVHRNIRNEYLRDFDLLAGEDPGVEIHYRDVRDTSEPLARPSTSPIPQTQLRAPDGSILATARITSGPSEGSEGFVLRGGLAALSVVTLVVWMWNPFPKRRLQWVLGLPALRAALLLLGPPLPDAVSPLLSPQVYASTFFEPLRFLRFLGPLLRSPLDLFFTALCTALLAALALQRAWLARRPSSIARGLASDVLCLGLVLGAFAWISDTTANCSLEIQAITLVPQGLPHLVIQLALLLILASLALLLLAVQLWGGPSPLGSMAALRWAGRALLGIGLWRLWPAAWIPPPAVPAIAMFLLAVWLAGRPALWSRLNALSPDARAGCAIIAVTLLSFVLYASLTYFGEENTRAQVEGNYSQLVRSQPEARRDALAQSQRRIDSLNLLESALPGPYPPLVEELAFAAWCSTDLASGGFSSAVEIQDADGTVISRFALNLPSLLERPQPLPSTRTWEVTEEPLPLVSAERRVLHARRELFYHGETHGAVHLYVGDDFANLPFVGGGDPYSVLYRTMPPGGSRGRLVGLVAYDKRARPVFSSAEHPPALDAALQSRLESGMPFWTALVIDRRPHSTFLFSDEHGFYALFYPKVEAGRYMADLFEAATGLTLVAVAVLVALILVRTALGRRSLSLRSIVTAVSERFSLRLFVAFMAVAILPVPVRQVVVRRFIQHRFQAEVEDDALERAAMAKKTIEDFAFVEQGDAAGNRPVTDAVLVWVASVIRNDVDVFEGGSLLASSKRELYASGLLPTRVSGSVFRGLVLEGMPYAIVVERIGEFSYSVVSVPVRLRGPEVHILSLPVGTARKEAESVLDDLDRTTRLASILFLVAAATLAHSMARRISGPIHELTRATQRVADGDLTARVSVTSRDEIRTLVESFNQMAQDLDRQRRDLERSNRLAAWAEMARQVAHEVKNPLTPIQLSAEHLRRVFGDPSIDFPATLETCTETILKQVRNLRGIVTEFSAFARPPGTAMERLDLGELVAETVRPYEGVLPKEVSLHVDLESGLPLVQADRRLLERAVVNLVENALQAVGEGGTIWVRLRRGEKRVEVQVDDSGPGIDPEIQGRMFEPFFSTKTNGSGLGLALVKKIAQDHGGDVSLESRPGQWTRATLWLPAAEGPST